MFGEKQVLISGTVAWVRKYGKGRLRLSLKDCNYAEGVIGSQKDKKGRWMLKIHNQKVEVLKA